MKVAERVLEWGVNLFLDHIDTSEVRLVATMESNSNEGSSLKNKNQQAMLPRTKARFTMSHDGNKFLCEECGGDKFHKVNDVKAACMDCNTVYLVEYSMLDINIVYYEG